MDQTFEMTALVNKARNLLLAVESQQRIDTITDLLTNIEASTGVFRQAYLEDLQREIEQAVGFSRLESPSFKSDLSKHLTDLIVSAHRSNFDPKEWFEDVQYSPSGEILAQILSY